MTDSRPAPSSRERRLPVVALLAMSTAVLLTFPGCETVPEPPRRPPVARTGDPIIDGNNDIAAAPDKDRVLLEYRLGVTALRMGNYEVAKAKFDDAIARIGGLLSGPADAAQRARGLFTAEREKVFIGEPYERVMAFYYRGLLYWHDGQPDNARACFRSAQLLDSDAESDAYKSDYVLLDYLDGLASAKLAADGSDALARAQKLTKNPLPPYDTEANVLCFVEFGRGPRKYAAGENGELLRFRTDPSRIRSATLTVGETNVSFLPWDNLNFQAVTRGGRVMDHVLGNKAVFKKGADTVGDVALVGAAVAASNINQEKRRVVTDEKGRRHVVTEYDKSEGAEFAAVALGVIGIFSKIAASATKTHADVRMWDNLPQYLSFGALRLPAGDHPATLQFFDANGQAVPDLTRRLVLKVGDPTKDTVIILSELKR
jgi:tetratricopeptide (TPR) repeat protein